jgi:hypothetical protein
VTPKVSDRLTADQFAPLHLLGKHIIPAIARL